MTNIELARIGMFLMGMVASASLFLLVQMGADVFKYRGKRKRKNEDIR